MKVAPIILGRILAGFILALAIPFGVCAQESVVVSYDGYAGFQGPCGRNFCVLGWLS